MLLLNHLFIATTNRCGVHVVSAPTVDGLDDASDNRHDMILGTSLPLLILHLLDANASLLLRDTYHAWIVSHARVDINIFRSDEQWAVCWPEVPAIDLPTQV